MKNNKNIWKEVLFEDLEGMSNTEKYKTLFIVLLYLPFVLILFPIVAIKKFRKRKDYYRQVEEYKYHHKSNTNGIGDNNEVWRKKQYNKQA